MKKRPRDPVQTKALILAAAMDEFARLELGGARIDGIAAKAGVNKRLIYGYFNSKDDLFQAVLEDIYADVRTAEAALGLDELDPVEAICALMRFTWNYYLKRPEFMSLVNSENLHKAVHVKRSSRFALLHVNFVDRIKRILDRGVAAGVFRAGVDPRHLYITITSVGYHYLNNRYTLEVIYGQNFVSADALEARFAFNVDIILRLLKP
ncbi:MAG: TetR/AcrR family transcriptional regulator [Sodalis sp. (in: enterobacteria)]|uniref:TetR/AcrR family transcriptional regulator n=1 Tax=Sodalis sp. (in: enterobacteria) TaxID=1898979 RepID=UPI003F2DE760